MRAKIVLTAKCYSLNLNGKSRSGTIDHAFLDTTPNRRKITSGLPSTSFKIKYLITYIGASGLPPVCIPVRVTKTTVPNWMMTS